MPIDPAVRRFYRALRGSELLGDLIRFPARAARAREPTRISQKG